MINSSGMIAAIAFHFVFYPPFTASILLQIEPNTSGNVDSLTLSETSLRLAERAAGILQQEYHRTRGDSTELVEV